ncbi:hypothetical protein JHK87_055449 [Glycine soja]|nr:hypothetical protein JHK87_055449 [Glycine soja]
MESRVRSRTGTLSSLPHLRKPPREVGAGPSLVTVKAVGSVANERNLFWVRQLRPKLCSPALKKEAFLLRPCLVIVGRGQEAKVAPAGFFEKYPALVTGFFFFTSWQPITTSSLKTPENAQMKKEKRECGAEALQSYDRGSLPSFLLLLVEPLENGEGCLLNYNICFRWSKSRGGS